MKRRDPRTIRISATPQIQRGGALVRKPGFALPTVLLSAVVMLMILVTAVSVTSSVSSGLRDQRYTELASAAADAGTVMATACLNKNGGQASWTNANPLRPNTDCSGQVISGLSAYVLEQDDVRTYFVVQQPLIGVGNVPVSSAVKGYSEVLRSSSGTAWRVWSSDTSVALVTANDGLPVGSYVEGAWTTAPAGYLLADGAAVSRMTYANLFAVIGTTYGAGNGSTTFNLPDLRGRVTVQRSTDAEFDALGEKYGAKTHTLTTAELPEAPLKVVAGSGGGGATNGPVLVGTTAGTTGFSNPGDVANYSNNRNTVASGGGEWASFRVAGSNGAHNNIQPSVVVNRAIKY